LGADLQREFEQRTEAIPESGIALDLAADVPDDAAEPDLKEFELPLGALELVGMRIAPTMMAARLGRVRGCAAVGCAIAFSWKVVSSTTRSRSLLSIAPARCAIKRLSCESAAILLLTQPLAPARQRRTIERHPMLEHHFRTDVLEIRVLQPPFAQRLIGEVVRVLEDEQAGHW
jgi:hypothetical protein